MPRKAASPELHLVIAVQLFRPFNLFLKTLLLLNPGAVVAPGRLQNLLANENGTISAQSQSDGVAGPRINQDQLPVDHYFDYGVEGVLPKFGDDYPPDDSSDLGDHVFQQIMSHRALWGEFFDFGGDGIGFIRPNPDRQYALAILLLQQNYRRVRGGIDQKASNLDFQLHNYLSSLNI